MCSFEIITKWPSIERHWLWVEIFLFQIHTQSLTNTIMSYNVVQFYFFRAYVWKKYQKVAWNCILSSARKCIHAFSDTFCPLVTRNKIKPKLLGIFMFLNCNEANKKGKLSAEIINIYSLGRDLIRKKKLWLRNGFVIILC